MQIVCKVYANSYVVGMFTYAIGRTLTRVMIHMRYTKMTTFISLNQSRINDARVSTSQKVYGFTSSSIYYKLSQKS